MKMDNTYNDILKWKDVPIPNPDFDIESVRNYQMIKIDNKNPLSRETLVDLREFDITGVNYYHSQFNPPYYQSIPGSIPELRSRKTVVEKLSRINEKLKFVGIELFIFDVFRPLAVQNYFYHQWVPQYLRSTYPEKDEEWIKKEASSYWAKGAKNKEGLLTSIPPHSTGAAVDLTLCFKETGHLLEMGSIFDDITERSHSTYFENCQDHKSFTIIEAQKNRRLLYHLMSAEGFTQHPKEWWHFSYGDQMWALISKQAVAFYGYAGNEFSI
ncbi:MAG: D-alanyl-D-alanine dipeptidase [candidate division WS2 bacterium]|nr:D-alanyl-D-alanine dipeptidase [Candidatus Lithacetigena glycinireducens]